MPSSDTAISIYVTGLQNLHAVENQAEQFINRNLDRLENYPQLAQILQRHGEETRRQKERLEQILNSLGEDRSAFKDFVTSVVGNVGALMHGPAGDEVLKNYFEGAAVEAYEIAAYTSLIAMAERAGQAAHVTLLQQSLEEERRMLQWMQDHTQEITLAYLTREEQGLKADR